MGGGHHPALGFHEPGPRHLPPLAGLGSLALQIVQSVSRRVEGFVASASLPLQPQHICWSPSRCTPSVVVGAGTATASSATFCDLQEQRPHLWVIRAELLEQVRRRVGRHPHRCPFLHRFHVHLLGKCQSPSLQHVPHSHHQSGLRTHCARTWYRGFRCPDRGGYLLLEDGSRSSSQSHLSLRTKSCVKQKNTK